MPLIVRYATAAPPAETRSRMSARGGLVGANLLGAWGVAVRERKRDATGFWSGVTTPAGAARTFAAGVDRIWLDGKRRVRLDESVPQIGAPAVWADGDTGQGVTVAVLDTGVDTTHPDLAGRIVAERNFTDAPSVDDEVGHGTHIASTIAGSGTASDGRYRGVAPGASLAIGKVCADLGCLESSILAGMQWAAVDAHARIVNMSFGSPDTPELDPVEDAVNTLTAQQGTLFVVSAGNDGPAEGSLSSPGSAQGALTVGAVDGDDAVATFSGRGAGDGQIKPDIVAPGVDIVAARATNGWVGQAEGEYYTRLSGTSMAAPHVAGAAALLLAVHPQWNADMLKAALMNSAAPATGGDVFTTGSGRVDVARAFHQQVLAQPPSIGLGVQLWPHSDDQPLTRVETYQNVGAAPVTLTVAVAVTGPSGQPAPPGLFTLSAAQLTLAAFSSGQVSLTADSRIPAPVGRYLGHVVATVDGAVVTSTPVAIEIEPERYSLTLRHTDAAGQPAAWYYTMLLRTDSDEERYVSGAPGPVTVRLPAGAYVLGSMVFSNPDSPHPSPTMFSYPVLVVDHDQTIDLDVRGARAVRFAVPDIAAPMAVNVGFDARTDRGPVSWQLEESGGATVSTRHLGATAPADRFVGRVEATLARPGPAGDFAASPYRYNLAWYPGGSLPTGFTGVVRRGEVATVAQTYVSAMPGWPANTVSQPQPIGQDWLAPGWLDAWRPFDLPATRTDYYLTRDVVWRDAFSQYDPDTWASYNQWSSEPVALRAGQRYQARWNGAVIGPTALGSPVMRWGDSLSVGIGMFSDGTPGHVGEAPYQSGSMVLYRDGQVYASQASIDHLWVDLPPEPADYRLTADVTAARTDLSSRIWAAWTFRSGQTSSSQPVPVMAVRFSPALDITDTAPSGRLFPLPIRVEGAVAGVQALAVQVSYDDGGHWFPAAVAKAGDAWVATVVHPAGAGTVALRAQAVDGHGETVQETILRAYHFG